MTREEALRMAVTVLYPKSPSDPPYTPSENRVADRILAAVAAETARCAKAVAEMRNQRHAYRRIIGDPKARLPGNEHWALPFVDDITLGELRQAQPLDQWHEADGDVLWWRFPIEEPPYVGSPLDTRWPGYHTHWTRIVLPADPDRQSGTGGEDA